MKPPYKYLKEFNSPRYLVVCDGGNVRSAAIATTLKLKHGREAIAVGRLYMSPSTMEILSDWADRIILTQPHMLVSIPEHDRNKCTITDVGLDRWGLSIHSELDAIAHKVAETLVNDE